MMIAKGRVPGCAQEISKSCKDACQVQVQSGGPTKFAAKEMEIGIAFISLLSRG